jgi:SAM-dependent methyltransferase
LHLQYSTAQLPLAVFESRLVEWPQGARVLECGCGTGIFWDNETLPRSIALTLTDLSEGMVAEASARASANSFSHVSGCACDVQDLPFEDRSFDVVLANHMLYHVPDPDRGVAEIARVVRPDGVVLAATNGVGHMREINEATAEVFGATVTADLYDVFGIDSGEARLRERFSSVVWHAYDNDLVVDDPDAVVAYALSFPPGESATEAQRMALRRAIDARFVDGFMRIRTRAGVFVCRRPRDKA